MKCACPNCDGHIEYPGELADASVSCPHCNEKLRLPKLSFHERPSFRFMLKILLGLVLLAFVFGVWEFCEKDSEIAAIWITLFCIFLYFLPYFIAAQRKHRNTLAIALINLFFGWTVVGWFAALIWAVYVEKPPSQPLMR